MFFLLVSFLPFRPPSPSAGRSLNYARRRPAIPSMARPGQLLQPGAEGKDTPPENFGRQCQEAVKTRSGSISSRDSRPGHYSTCPCLCRSLLREEVSRSFTFGSAAKLNQFLLLFASGKYGDNLTGYFLAEEKRGYFLLLVSVSFFCCWCWCCCWAQ